ncbi:MAG TPA: GNAT family N-acetyltransferase [bacterium]|nr:GNAT family N-acetyltransferase [bacterium]
MSYKYWQKTNLENSDTKNIIEKYNAGFVLTRIKNEMHQIKSLRLDLKQFSLSSENRRILRKSEDLQIKVLELPFDMKKYDWHIHAVGSEFYRTRFGAHIFSANKIKELITDPLRSNFNRLVVLQDKKNNHSIGWCIGFEAADLFHYSYPFYDLEYFQQGTGMTMLLKTALWARDKNISQFYLGSIWDEKAKYKLQLQPAYFFDGESWQTTKNLKF